MSTLLIGVAAPPAAGAPSQSEGWAAVRDAEGAWRLVSSAEASATPPEGGGFEVATGWVWSTSAPPREVGPEDWRQELLAVGSPALPPRSRLEVRLREPCAPRCGDLAVLAAPRAMWEQVGEGWLPSWPVPDSGRVSIPRTPSEPWRIRLIGQGRGSWWQDVPASASSVLVEPVPAVDVPLLVTAAGETLERFDVAILLDDPSGYRGAVLAQARSTTGEPLTLPAVPRGGRAVFLAASPGYVPWVMVGRGEDLPQPIRLAAGARVIGRFVDGQGEPVAGVAVTGEGWVSPRVPLTITREAKSGDDGRWAVSQLPAGRVVVEGEKRGLRTHNVPLDLAEGELVDLGSIELLPGAILRVAITDPEGEPIAGAFVTPAGVPRRATDREGIAELPGLALDAPLRLRIEADRFLPTEAAVPSPWPDPFTVALERGLRITGVFADAEGLSVEAGSVRIESGSSFRTEELAAGGAFDLLLEPDAEQALVLSSPATPATRVALAPGSPGEERDLGIVRAAPGLVVTGRLVAADDAAPVAGARVWTPRLPEHGALAAWALGDLVEATSDAAGDFKVTGLAFRPQELVVEAAGFARRYLEVRAAEGEPSVDVGMVELERGSTVTVDLSKLEAEDADLEARLDLRGAWRELDMLTAPVVEGAAEFVEVPPGTSLLTVLARGEIVCEKRIEVPDDGRSVAVACDGDSGEVAGIVLVGERPAGPGSLTWQPPQVEGLSGAIFNQLSTRGVLQQRTVGAGRPPVRVEVAGDGSFRSRRVGAGRWEVSWQPAAGDRFAPQLVDVPAGGVANLVLRFAGHVVSGVVLDDDGNPLPGALVRDVDGAATALTGDDGSFRFAGAQGRSLRLQARWRGRYSSLVEVMLEPDRAPAPVELVVRDQHEGRIEVTVWSASGAPAAGAFVFAREESGGTRVISADRDGRAQLTFAEPYPARLCTAAHAAGKWVFGSCVSWEEAGEGLSLAVEETGGLTLTADEAAGPASLVSAAGWDVTQLLTVLGAPPLVAPGRPVVVDGLPSGVYHLLFEQRRSVVTVEQGEMTEVRLD